MSEENTTPTRKFAEVSDVHHLREPRSEWSYNLQSQLLDRRISSSEVDMRIKAIVAPWPRSQER